MIEVEVRRGGSTAAARPAQPAAPVVAVTTATPTSAAANAPIAGRGRRVLGGLLRQASHAVRGERLSLAEATGLPETVNLQAHVAGRTLSTSIRL